MQVRGKVFRDANQGDGVVYVDGQQKPFSLSHWRSANPPKVGDVVDVTLAEDGSITALALVDAQQLIKERARHTAGALGAHGQAGARLLLSKVPAPLLAAVGLLALSWLTLNTVTLGEMGLSFYGLLRLINAPEGADLGSPERIRQFGAGVYALLMCLCLAAPLLTYFHPNRWLPLGACLPAIFMLLVQWGAYASVMGQIKQAAVLGGAFGGDMARQMVERAMESFVNALGAGLGFYLSWLLALFLAYLGVRRFIRMPKTEAARQIL